MVYNKIWIPHSGNPITSGIAIHDSSGFTNVANTIDGNSTTYATSPIGTPPTYPWIIYDFGSGINFTLITWNRSALGSNFQRIYGYHSNDPSGSWSGLFTDQAGDESVTGWCNRFVTPAVHNARYLKIRVYDSAAFGERRIYELGFYAIDLFKLPSNSGVIESGTLDGVTSQNELRRIFDESISDTNILISGSRYIDFIFDRNRNIGQISGYIRGGHVDVVFDLYGSGTNDVGVTRLLTTKVAQTAWKKMLIPSGGDASGQGSGINLLRLQHNPSNPWPVRPNEIIFYENIIEVNNDINYDIRAIGTKIYDTNFNIKAYFWRYASKNISYLIKANYEQKNNISYNICVERKYKYISQITIDKTKVKENLTNFPALINLTSGNFDFSRCQSSGQDIRFASGLATNINICYCYEIEQWDNVNKAANVWVKIPAVYSGIDTIFYMHYGRYDVDDFQRASGVWDANHVIVNHFASGTAKDSTINNYNGLASGATIPVIAGKIASGASMPGGLYTTCGYFNYGDKDAFSFTNETFSASLWIYPTGARPGVLGSYIFCKGDTPSKYEYALSSVSSGLSFILWASAGGTVASITTSGNISSDQWYKVDVVASGDSAWIKLYINGQQSGHQGTLTGGMSNTASPLEVGRRKDMGTGFSGIIDEFRLSNSARSSGWIYADYCSQSNQLLTITDVVYSGLSDINYVIKANKFFEANLNYLIKLNAENLYDINYNIGVVSGYISDLDYYIQAIGFSQNDINYLIKSNAENLYDINYNIDAVNGYISDLDYYIRAIGLAQNDLDFDIRVYLWHYASENIPCLIKADYEQKSDINYAVKLNVMSINDAEYSAKANVAEKKDLVYKVNAAYTSKNNIGFNIKSNVMSINDVTYSAKANVTIKKDLAYKVNAAGVSKNNIGYYIKAYKLAVDFSSYVISDNYVSGSITGTLVGISGYLSEGTKNFSWPASYYYRLDYDDGSVRSAISGIYSGIYATRLYTTLYANDTRDIELFASGISGVPLGTIYAYSSVLINAKLKLEYLSTSISSGFIDSNAGINIYFSAAISGRDFSNLKYHRFYNVDDEAVF